MGSSRERHSDNPAFLLLKALITGQKIFFASGDGDVNKKTVVCADFTSIADQDGNQIHIVDVNSNAHDQTRDIEGSTALGTITVKNAFDCQITEDTAFIVSGIRSTPVEVAAVQAAIDKVHDRQILGGTVYFVGKGGNDANAGTSWANRRLTVASGYGLCVSGDTLIIGSGTFTEDINFNTDGVWVFGRGQGLDGTMITGASTMTCRSNRFEGIFFYNTAGTVVKVGTDANANYNEFPNCRIGGAGSAIPLHIDGSVADGGCFNIFDKCNIYEGSTAAVLIDGGAATGNIFRNNCRIRPQTGVASHGIHVNHANALRNTFINCNVVGAGSTGTGIYIQAGSQNIALNCHVDGITTPYNIAAGNYIVGCHENSEITANNTIQDDLKAIHDDTKYLVTDNIMGTVSPVGDGSIVEYIKYAREMIRGHAQTRIGLIVPDLSNIGSDATNAAMFTLLNEISTTNYIDQTEVDGGEQNWLEYNLLVVGSDTNYGFTTANLDDLVTMKIPIIVVSSAVAIHLNMGHNGVADTGSVTNIYVETIGDRVMALVFGATGDQTIFSAGSVSSRLDMSDAQLTENLLATVGGGAGGTNAETVIGDMPYADGSGAINTLDDGTELPAGRVFAGCFLNAGNLNSTGEELFRQLCRNITQSMTTPSLEIKANAAKVNRIWGETYAAGLAQAGGSVASNAQLDSLVRAIADIVRAGGSGDLADILAQTEERVAGREQIAKTTEDLNQIAATYDLFIGTTQDVLLESLLIRMPDIVAAGAITSISIQTDGTTPQVLLSAADGAVANLTAEAQLAWQNFNAPILIKVGKKVQLTIAGGAHGDPYVCDIVAKTRAVTSGGYLA